MSAADDDDDGADHYAVLGVDGTATPAEIRRAYRRLALRHHPDRAGAAGAARFLRIAAAYRVLSDAGARAVYDRARRRAAATRLGDGTAAGVAVGFSPDGRAELRRRPVPDLLRRLSGPLEALIARGVARVAPDGLVELVLVAPEIAAGGTAVVEIDLRVSCPSCGGVARPGGVWCRRCEFSGLVVEPIAVHVPVPPEVADGALYVIPAERLPGMVRSLGFRFRTAAG